MNDNKTSKRRRKGEDRTVEFMTFKKDGNLFGVKRYEYNLSSHRMRGLIGLFNDELSTFDGTDAGVQAVEWLVDRGLSEEIAGPLVATAYFKPLKLAAQPLISALVSQAVFKDDESMAIEAAEVVLGLRSSEI